MKRTGTGVNCELRHPHLVMIPAKKLIPAPYFVKKPPRDTLRPLVESIRRQGLLAPLGVRRLSGRKRRYEVLFGARRFFACKELGLNKIPCLLYPQNARGELLSLVENLVRSEAASETLKLHARLRDAAPAAFCRTLDLPLPPVLEKERKLRGISLFEETTDEEPPRAPTPKILFRDVRLIANSIDRALELGKSAGFGIEAQKIERGREICYHIRLPRDPNAADPSPFPRAG